MTIQEQIQNDLKDAMRSGDKHRVEVLRMAMAALKNAQIERVKAAYDAAAAAGDASAAAIDRSEPLSEAAMQEAIAREVKRRRETADTFRQGGREEQAAREEQGAAILEAYLPRQLSPEELRPLVEAVVAELGARGPGDMGKVMPVLVQRFKGQADGRVINQVARDVLSQSR